MAHEGETCDRCVRRIAEDLPVKAGTLTDSQTRLFVQCLIEAWVARYGPIHGQGITEEAPAQADVTVHHSVLMEGEQRLHAAFQPPRQFGEIACGKVCCNLGRVPQGMAYPRRRRDQQSGAMFRVRPCRLSRRVSCGGFRSTDGKRSASHTPTACSVSRTQRAATTSNDFQRCRQPSFSAEFSAKRPST